MTILRAAMKHVNLIAILLRIALMWWLIIELARFNLRHV